MFEYYKYNFEEEDEETTNLVELDSEGYCLRAILEKNNEAFTSNFVSPKNPCILPEGSLIEFKNEMVKIEASNFKDKWDEVMNSKRATFEKMKGLNPIGNIIESTINCFYPQGVILNINSEIHGITNYQKCIKIIGSDKMYHGTAIRSKVTGYDDENLMLIFETLDYL